MNESLFVRQCNITAGQFPCLKKGCFEEHQVCDGRNDCEVRNTSFLLFGGDEIIMFSLINQ